MTRVYNFDKQHPIGDGWYTVWTSEENGYVTKLIFSESIRELDNSPGFIVSVYDRLAMEVVKLVCISEDDMLRHAVVPINIEIKPRAERVTLNLVPREIEQ